MRFNTIFSLLALGALLACSLGTSEASAEEKKKDVKNFRVTTTAAAVATGTDGKINVSITPAKGYKWNKDFPASLKFGDESNDFITMGTKMFRGDAFKAGKKNVSLAAGFKGTKAGESRVAGELRFSVCNEESCITYTEKITANILVK